MKQNDELFKNCTEIWNLCLDIIKDKSFWALAVKSGLEFVTYLKAFQATRAGFTAGNFICGLFVASAGPNA